MSRQLNDFKKHYAKDPLFIKGQEHAAESIPEGTWLSSWRELEKFDDKVKELQNVFMYGLEPDQKVDKHDDLTMIHELENIAWMQMRFEDPQEAYDGIVKYGMWAHDCFAEPQTDLWPYSTSRNIRVSPRSMTVGKLEQVGDWFEGLAE